MSPSVHLYAVGDAVVCELLRGLAGSSACSVVKLLPPLGTQMQYRIKFDDEKFERVVVEEHLTPVAVAA